MVTFRYKWYIFIRRTNNNEYKTIKDYKTFIITKKAPGRKDIIVESSQSISKSQIFLDSFQTFNDTWI